jgi:hypothetical protein
MRISWPGTLLSLVLVQLFSFFSLAMDQPGTARAMLQASGNVQVNGTAGPTTTALLLGDLVETYDHSVAIITTAGTSILVMPNSAVKLERTAVELRHGDVIIASSNAVAVRADDLTIEPATKKQSKFEIAENENSVTVAARQGDLNLSDDRDSSTVQEGQQSTRKKKKKKADGALPAAKGPLLLPGKDIAVLAGAAGIAIVAILIVDQDLKHCVSPTGDRNCVLP